MLDQEYIQEFRESDTFELIKKGVERNQIRQILLGEGIYSMSWFPIPAPTDPSLVIIALHILVNENLVSNKKINEVLNSIDIENVCLLLDYIKTYLIYRSVEKVLIIDYDKLYNKIKEKESFYMGLFCYNKIDNDIKEIINN